MAKLGPNGLGVLYELIGQWRTNATLFWLTHTSLDCVKIEYYEMRLVPPPKLLKLREKAEIIGTYSILNFTSPHHHHFHLFLSFSYLFPFSRILCLLTHKFSVCPHTFFWIIKCFWEKDNDYYFAVPLLVLLLYNINTLLFRILCTLKISTYTILNFFYFRKGNHHMNGR